MCHLARATHDRPTVDPPQHRGPPDPPPRRQTPPPAVSHCSNAAARFRPAPDYPRRATQQPSATISSDLSPHLRHWHFPFKISFSPYTFPLRRIQLRADSTSHPARLSSSSPCPTKELRPWPF